MNASEQYLKGIEVCHIKKRITKRSMTNGTKNSCPHCRVGIEGWQRIILVRGFSSHRRGTMNKDILEGKWKKLRGSAKAWWGQLSDRDLDQIQGRYERLIGKLQERYGYTRQEAENEIQKFLKQAADQIPEHR
jgi:uncharacterized protein YjbJ (UPF0337 family)